jgi:hypothetical protein
VTSGHTYIARLLQELIERDVVTNSVDSFVESLKIRQESDRENQANSEEDLQAMVESTGAQTFGNAPVLVLGALINIADCTEITTRHVVNMSAGSSKLPEFLRTSQPGSEQIAFELPAHGATTYSRLFGPEGTDPITHIVIEIFVQGKKHVAILHLRFADGCFASIHSSGLVEWTYPITEDAPAPKGKAFEQVCQQNYPAAMRTTNLELALHGEDLPRQARLIASITALPEFLRSFIR